jgi:hypothetical protein
MNTQITDAIQKQEILSLVYKNVARMVEPHAYGESTAGNEILRCFQVSGGHTSDKPHDWDLLTVSKISSLSSTGEKFSGPRPDYKRGDKAMTRIFAEL